MSTTTISMLLPQVPLVISGVGLALLITAAVLSIFNEYIGQRVAAWMYLFDGTNIIARSFMKANGNPFEVLAPDNRYVFVSSEKHIREIDRAPDTVLSLQAASKQMLQPMYTMHGFNWFDRRGTEGVGFIRALRTLLTNNVSNILPNLSTVIKSRIEEMGAADGRSKGSFKLQIYPSIVQLVVLSNAISFFGEELANNSQFMESAFSYIEETVLCAEVVKLLPGAVSPLIGGLIARSLKSHKVLFEGLVQVAEERCRQRDLKNHGHSVPQHADCIQWIMETSPRQKPWNAERIVYELMAIWFGSVHAMATTITFAVHDLCLHPAYKEPLRQELTANYREFEQSAVGLPLLDSFIKESARLTPVESMSTRRSALRPFTLSDGTAVSTGEWLCTPVRAIMQSPEHYPEPTTFHGFRFAGLKQQPQFSDATELNFRQPAPSKLTDADYTWHVWGTGRMVCPGRFYATAVMKVVMAQIILNYDCELENAQRRRWFSWRSTVLPLKSTKVRFTQI